VTPLERIREIAVRVAGTYGLLVDDVVMRRERGNDVLRVVLDRPGPGATPEDSVSITDCERVSQELSTILDVEDLLPDSYTLEVSSPGLDRPLRDARDYVRFAGRLAYAELLARVGEQERQESEQPAGRDHRPFQ
jgi:ribosome maturation factor RimP